MHTLPEIKFLFLFCFIFFICILFHTCGHTCYMCVLHMTCMYFILIFNSAPLPQDRSLLPPELVLPFLFCFLFLFLFVFVFVWWIEFYQNTKENWYFEFRVKTPRKTGAPLPPDPNLSLSLPPPLELVLPFLVI